MENLIPIISKLQDVFATLGCDKSEIQLPQIIVVGSQSAGKSSVIEGIVGRDFLPRGSGIVTRRPLLIHLTNVPKDEDKRESEGDWATFEHVPNKIYTDFEQICAEIEAETDRLTGTEKEISTETIILKIFSANVVTLSLIDLPGITKVPVGKQPLDIENIIREMILSFIKNPQSIILAVTPANQDFANSDALKLAREVDPDGTRTICVLTKLDLMDRGTDAMNVLTGNVIPVKLGIYGVVNRSQADIDDNKSVKDCINDEMAFLSKKYPTLASKHGIQNLAKHLGKHLIFHIRQCLPDLKRHISKRIGDLQAKLELIGRPIEDKKKTFLQVINHFSTAYIATIDGSSKNIGSSKLSGGARICSIFYDEFEKNVEEKKAMDDLSVEEVVSAIKNGFGLKPAMFIPERSFDILIKKQMKRFKGPMINCVDLVYEELLRIIQHCGTDIEQEMERFPLLYDRIRKIVSTILSARIIKTKEFIEDYLEIELAFINTKHPEFTISEDLVKAFNEDPDAADIQGDDAQNLTSREKRDYCVIERLINQYFLLVQKSIKDKVPKAIMKFLINYIIENLHAELTERLYDPFNVDELLVESGKMTQLRKETMETLVAFNKANDALSEVRDYEIW